MPQTHYDFGGTGSVMHMALANGFPPQTYIPLLQPFTDHYRVLSFPPRALWDNPPQPQSMSSWQDMADDILAALDAHGIDKVIGVGHSMGAVATMLAAIQAPERFRGIVLLDPTIFPPIALNVMAAMRLVGLESRFPLINKAMRRRAHFDSTESAFAYWRKKSLFADWDDAVLRHYVDGLTRPDANGVTLMWSPEWEARYYATIYTGSWRKVPKLRGLLPVLTIRGTTTNTFLSPAAERMRRVLPAMTYAEIEGHGHLFPQSAPEQTRTIMDDWLHTLD